MKGIKSTPWIYNGAILIAMATCILGQAQLDYRKPWPTYSLQNMPHTRFTCHDKILGGYYADAETQCQMFHVCVKVAGVGVQDFRFLCPNGTAFDQEAQICADWGDVDCESSVLYYGSDNFDLYRLGSGFESKRAPLAEEEEATFHLQRAESSDIRRSKETRIDQKVRPEQPPNYSKHFGATPQRNSFHNNYANSNANNNEYQNQPTQAKKIETTPARRPIANYYTPTSSTTTPTTTSTTTESYFDDSKQEYDDIFKGSHSSHFFANRNGGREDDFIDHPVKTKFNDFIDYNKKTTAELSTTGKTRTQPTRPKRIQHSSTTARSTTTTTATTNAPKITKKVTLQTYYNASAYDFTQQKLTTFPMASAAAIATAGFSTSTASSTTRPNYVSANRFSFSSNDYQTQEKIEPTTYNPSNSIYRIKSTTPKYSELNRDNGVSSRGRSPSPNTYLPNESTKSQNKPTASGRKSQKLERTQQKIAARNSSFAIASEFDDFPKIKLQQPQSFQPSLPQQPSQATHASQPSHRSASVGPYQEPQFYRSRSSVAEKSLRQGTQEPAPFSGPQKHRGTTSPTAPVSTIKSSTNAESRPRGFASRGSINYKATTQRETDYYAPTTSSTKKFSTLVPKSQHSVTPTTFKPTTYQKSLDTFYYQTQQTVRPSSKTTKQPNIAINNLTPTTANPYYDPDEDDGQYHPELYEVDFPRNRFKLQRSSTSTSTTTTTTTARPHNYNNDFQNPQKHLKTQQQTAFRKQQEQAEPVDLSDEDELFKTAHSLNFGAASINKLRADIFKAEKTSQQYNSQYSPKVESSSASTAISTAHTITTPSTTLNYYAYSSTTQPATKLYSTSISIPSTTAAPSTTVTTRRPTTFVTTPYAFVQSPTPKVTKAPKSSKSSSKKGKKGKGASKRPPHADEDTSYDYAYYDTDTLSESPQEYPEYEIAEFVKTHKN